MGNNMTKRDFWEFFFSFVLPINYSGFCSFLFFFYFLILFKVNKLFGFFFGESCWSLDGPSHHSRTLIFAELRFRSRNKLEKTITEERKSVFASHDRECIEFFRASVYARFFFFFIPPSHGFLLFTYIALACWDKEKYSMHRWSLEPTDGNDCEAKYTGGNVYRYMKHARSFLWGFLLLLFRDKHTNKFFFLSVLFCYGFEITDWFKFLCPGARDKVNRRF